MDVQKNKNEKDFKKNKSIPRKEFLKRSIATAGFVVLNKQKLLDSSKQITNPVAFMNGIDMISEPFKQNLSVQSMDFGWKFKRGDNDSAKNISFYDKNWESVHLPHDWSIKGPFNKNAPAGGAGGYLPTGIGWYRKYFNLPEYAKGRHVWVQFDGVYMNSDVWLNGHHLGNHPYGYTSFYYDLTPYLKNEDNVIAVRVDNSQQPNSRWYSGSGIYRHVWLMMRDPLHISHWGVNVTTPKVSAKSASVTILTEIENKGSQSKKAVLQSIIEDPSGKKVAQTTTTFSLNSNSQNSYTQKVDVPDPRLWSVENPYMYKLRSIITIENNQIDEIITPFGIRSIKYDVDKGFFLNGEHIKMKGVCLHENGGCVGAAIPIGVWERRLKSLKAMGCNAIRTAHNEPAESFLDLCDRMGFLVMEGSFDEWQIGKVKYGYHIYFDQWSQRDLVSIIRHDRNHPSVVMWCAGNEIREQSKEDGINVLRPLIDTIHREDPTRPVTTANDEIAADSGAAKIPFLDALDIVGYNYVDRWHERRELYYSIDRLKHQNWKMVGTECVAVNGIRGNYNLNGYKGFFPMQKDPYDIKPSYNFSMIRPEQLWKFVSTRDYVIGDFMWAGIDYLGESMWPAKNNPSGVLDLCGFPKDGYYFYKSRWTNKPMIHLFPHWNWRGHEGEIIPVLCYTNCHEVELFLNGKSMGIKRIKFPRQGTSGKWNHYANPRVFPTTADLHLSWDVPYQPGILKAVGKINGKVAYTQEVHTAGKPAAIQMVTDRKSLVANQRDVFHAEIKIIDDKGVVVPTADNLVNFHIKGEGTIIGVGNGNPVDHSSFQAHHRKAFNGLCLAIVQSTNKEGSIHFEAISKGLKSDSTIVRTTKKKSSVKRL